MKLKEALLEEMRNREAENWTCIPLTVLEVIINQSEE